MFGLRKRPPTAPVTYLEERRVPAHDFTIPVPYDSYRPSPYGMLNEFCEDAMLPRLTEALERLFQGKAVDEFNGACLDNSIIAAAANAALSLERQNTDHQDILRRLSARREADQQSFSRMLTLRIEEQQSLQAEYDRVFALLTESKEV